MDFQNDNGASGASASYAVERTSFDSKEIFERDVDCPLDINHYDIDAKETSEPDLHRLTRGAEMIPRTLLESSIAGMVGAAAVLDIATATLMALMGILIQCLMTKYATKQGPVLWWAGLAPFVLGILGIYIASGRSRRKVYFWGISSLLLAVTQTAIMGWVGNYTTSHYDVWPLHQKRNDIVVCSMMGSKCYCQDYYHGVYSTLELPDVYYFYKDSIKWRRTVFDTCGHLGAITALFWSFHVAWILFVLSSFVSFGLGMAGGVCSKEPGTDFQTLKDENEDEECAEGSQLDEDLDGNIVDGRLEVTYSEFERY